MLFLWELPSGRIVGKPELGISKTPAHRGPYLWLPHPKVIPCLNSFFMAPQSSIAHYRITAKLGEGGMGAVYRATDTKLGRDVAIKVLPPAFAEDSARMQRFEREAQVLASLNHPNIAAIYGIEESAIVMELVEGD